MAGATVHDRDDRPCALYRMRDETGELLYVGISFTAMKRIEDHLRAKGWFRDVRSIDLEWFPTRAAALNAEARAITRERPLHNLVYATPPRRSPAEALNAAQDRGVPLDGMRQAVSALTLIDTEASA